MPDLSFSVGTNGDLVYSDSNQKPRFVKSVDQSAQLLAGIAATQLASGNVTRQLLSFAVNITPVQTALSTAAEQAFGTFTGLLVGDIVLGVMPPGAPTAGLVGPANARVSAGNTLAMSWGNCTAGNLTAPAGIYTVVVLR